MMPSRPVRLETGAGASAPVDLLVANFHTLSPTGKLFPVVHHSLRMMPALALLNTARRNRHLVNTLRNSHQHP
jgi:hypothetical protein